MMSDEAKERDERTITVRVVPDLSVLDGFLHELLEFIDRYDVGQDRSEAHSAQHGT